jgi:hypothetical protein
MIKKLSIAALMLVGIIACSVTGDPLDDVVAVPVEYVQPEAITTPGHPEQQVAVVSKEELLQAKTLPQEVGKALDLFFPNEDTLAITSRRFLLEETPPEKVFMITIPTVFNPNTGESKPDPWAWVGQAVPAIGAAIPGAAPLLPLAGLLISLFRRRSQRHVAKAIKAIVPVDGKVDLVEGYKSLEKAVGWRHTEDSPEDLLESLKRVAKESGKAVAVGPDGQPFLRELK